ncbi:MAG: UbiA-like polyprenyltransferase [Acidobacteriota bacterium]
MNRWIANARICLEMIKFEHTVFALPFALLGAFLAARGAPPTRVLFWIAVAMLGARSAAMAFNRWADRSFDAENPRTSGRALPRRLVSAGFVLGFTVFFAAVFFLAAWQLNWLTLALAPLALVIVLAYSYTKRFTAMSHFFLGLALAVAPVGGWIAVRGEVSLEPWLLALCVLLWVSGFDLIYACQDVEFDRGRGLYSIPARFGVGATLGLSIGLHAAMVALLLILHHLLGLGVLSLAGIAVVAALLIYEHALVRPDDLSRVNAAFFMVNGIISVILLIFIGADLMWR